MKSTIRGLALAGLCLMAAGTASAGVTVAYSDPGRFSDMPFASWERDEVLRDLTEHFQKLGQALPPDVNLKVEVLDVDLAGRLHPNFRGGRELRVLRGGADWPMVHLRYTLEQGGKVIGTGEERLRDMMYLDHHRASRYLDGDSLRYEKHMIDEWFNQKFVGKRAG